MAVYGSYFYIVENYLLHAVQDTIGLRLYFFTLLYTLFIRKKVFTLSREYFFLLIFRSFKCEGFEFQMFTLQVLMLL